MNCLAANLPLCKRCAQAQKIKIHWNRATRSWGPEIIPPCWIIYWKQNFPNVPMTVIKKTHLKNVYLHKALELYYPDKFEELSKLLILL
jgi:hypothetical protein